MITSVTDPANYAVNAFAIPTVVTATAILLLGALVLVRERGSAVNALFGLMTAMTSWWLYAFSWMYCAVSGSAALWWAKAAYVVMPFLPASIYHFTVTLLQVFPRYRRAMWLIWLTSALFAGLNVSTTLLISGLYHYPWGYYPKYGRLSAPYLVFFCGLLVANARLYWQARRTLQPGTVHQRRLTALLWAFGIGYLGVWDFLPKLGVPLYPWGYVPILGFVVVAARAIWRYHLVDLTPAFAAPQILTTMADALIVLDAEGTVRVVNHAACQLFGRSPRELTGRPLSSIADAVLPPERREHLMRTGGMQRYEVVYPNGHAAEPVTLELSASLLRDRSQQPVGIVCIAQDITLRKRAEEALTALNETLEQRAAERSAAAEQRAQELAQANAELDTVMQELRVINERLEHLSLLDPLTELFNRRGLQQALSQEIRWARREGSTLLAMLLDLDNFKQINDALGYAVGDVVLKEVSHKLKATVRATDHVARIGGDEFMVLLPRTRMAEGVRVAEKVRLGISGAPILVSEGKTVTVTASLGLVAVAPETPSLNELVSEAHFSLHRSKASGKNRVFYERRGTARTVIDAARNAQRGEAVLLHVLEALRRGDRLRVLAQPIVRLQDLQPVGYELLSRLTIATFELPDDFFRVCLEANMLTLADHQCFKACVATAALLPPHLQCHLNLFPSTLINIPAQELLEAFPNGSGQEAYCLELSEQQIIGEPSYLVGHVEAFKRAGLRVAIDDVGFGHSSLESLVILEPDLIKIDRRCVQGIATDFSRARSLQRLLKIALALGTGVVAEGIEAPEDVRVLKELGVNYGQGFLFGKPADPLTIGGQSAREPLVGQRHEK